MDASFPGPSPHCWLSDAWSQPSFHRGAGDPNSVLMLVWQVFYLLSRSSATLLGFFETGSNYVVLADLELTVEQASLQLAAILLPNAGITEYVPSQPS